MVRARATEVDVSDVVLTAPGGERSPLVPPAGIAVVVLMRHRHQLPCQEHLVQVQRERGEDDRIGLVLVGFSPADRLAAVVRSRGWSGAVLSDPDLRLYSRLGIGRAPLWRVWNPGTLAVYRRARRGGWRPSPTSGEDLRRLGGDAVVVDGVVRVLWRPRSPDDRPPAAEVLAAARGHLP